MVGSRWRQELVDEHSSEPDMEEYGYRDDRPGCQVVYGSDGTDHDEKSNQQQKNCQVNNECDH